MNTLALYEKNWVKHVDRLGSDMLLWKYEYCNILDQYASIGRSSWNSMLDTLSVGDEEEDDDDDP